MVILNLQYQKTKEKRKRKKNQNSKTIYGVILFGSSDLQGCKAAKKCQGNRFVFFLFSIETKLI